MLIESGDDNLAATFSPELAMFSNIRAGEGVPEVAEFIMLMGGLGAPAE